MGIIPDVHLKYAKLSKFFSILKITLKVREINVFKLTFKNIKKWKENNPFIRILL